MGRNSQDEMEEEKAERREITFRKKGKEAKIYRGCAKYLVCEWNGGDSEISSVYDGQLLFKNKNIKYKGKTVDGFKVPEDVADEVKNWLEELEEERKEVIEKDMREKEKERQEKIDQGKIRIQNNPTWGNIVHGLGKQKESIEAEILNELFRHKWEPNDPDTLPSELVQDILEDVEEYEYYETTVEEFIELLDDGVVEKTKEKVIGDARDEAEKEMKKEERKEEMREKKERLFEKAKKSGVKQKIRSYAATCMNPDEECDVDIVTVYAMPDKTVKKEAHHTW